MERMPDGKKEAGIKPGEVVDWCLQRVRQNEETEKLAIIIEQGKRDMKAGKVPDFDFLLVLREMQYILTDDPEDLNMAKYISGLAESVRKLRRTYLEEKTGQMERPKDEPIPPFTGGVMEA
jgi:hypothetical protein